MTIDRLAGMQALAYEGLEELLGGWRDREPFGTRSLDACLTFRFRSLVDTL